MADRPLTYTKTDGAREGTLVFTLVGPLTLSNMFGLQAELRAVTAPLTVFDLTDSEYMDSAGLGVLINFHVAAQKRGAKMALVGVNDRVAALLQMTHVESLLRPFPTLADAESGA